MVTIMWGTLVWMVRSCTDSGTDSVNFQRVFNRMPHSRTPSNFESQEIGAICSTGLSIDEKTENIDLEKWGYLQIGKLRQMSCFRIRARITTIDKMCDISKFVNGTFGVFFLNSNKRLNGVGVHGNWASFSMKQ